MIRIPAKNGFERVGRLVKVSALVAQLDALCSGPRRALLDPVADGERLADIVAGWDAEKRRKLALLANVIPKSGKLPSAETWACVEAFLRDRARRAA